MGDSIKSEGNKAGISNTEKPYTVCVPNKCQHKITAVSSILKMKISSAGQKEPLLEVWGRFSVTVKTSATSKLLHFRLFGGFLCFFLLCFLVLFLVVFFKELIYPIFTCEN